MKQPALDYLGVVHLLRKLVRGVDPPEPTTREQTDDATTPDTDKELER